MIDIYHKKNRCYVILFECGIETTDHIFEALEGEITFSAFIISLKGFFQGDLSVV